MRKTFLLMAMLIIAISISAQNYRSANGMPGSGYWQNKPSYTIQADLNDNEKSLSGSENIVYVNNCPNSLDSIVFNLYENYHPTPSFNIKSVYVNGKLCQSFNCKGTKMIVNLSSPVASGDSVLLCVEWDFKFVDSSHKRMGYYDGDYFVGYWYPQIAVYDDNGWDMVNHTGTEEFYFEWADYDVTLFTHNNYMVYASVPAENQCDTKTNADNVWHFMAINFPDFAFVATNSMTIDSNSVILGDGRTITVITMAKSGEFYKNVMRPALNFIRKASDVTSPQIEFPFSQVVLFENGNSNGGMEFPGMVNLGIHWFDSETCEFIVSHELAHQYTPFLAGFNQAVEGFMDEGMAMLLPYLATQREPIHDKPTSIQFIFMETGSSTGALDEYKYFPEYEMVKPSYSYSSSSDYNLISYNKSYQALANLREVLGADKMDRLLHRFFTEWSGKHPTAQDFLNAATSAYGSDLSWFINPWYHSPKRPDLKIESTGQKNGKYFVTVRNVNGVPVPLKLLAATLLPETDWNQPIADPQHFFFSPEIWKDKDTYTIYFDKKKFPIVIKVGCDEIPDAVSDNYLELKSAADFGVVKKK